MGVFASGVGGDYTTVTQRGASPELTALEIYLN